jgi:hypothetical protein
LKTNRDAGVVGERPFDVAVVFRVYPRISKNPPVFPDDKYRLVELGLNSFRRSCGLLRVKVWVLLDNCPDVYERLFRRVLEGFDVTVIRLDGVGNVKTFLRQIEILCEQNDSDLVYLAEDDYFYTSEAMVRMVDWIRSGPEVDFVSPYDHSGIYTNDLHRHRRRFVVSCGRTWKTVNSTCLTFLAKQDALRKTRQVFETYKQRNSDAGIWISLTKARVFNLGFALKHLVVRQSLAVVWVKAWWHTWRQILFGKTWTLWAPMPSLATHMERRFLAPGVDWFARFESETRGIP